MADRDAAEKSFFFFFFFFPLLFGAGAQSGVLEREDLSVVLVGLQSVYIDIFLVLLLPIPDVSRKRQAFYTLMTCRHVSEYVRASVFVGFVALVLPMSFLKSPMLEIFECVHVSEHFAVLVMIYRFTFEDNF